MASDAAMGKRRAEAVARIEHQCEALAGQGHALNLPVRSHYGPEMLLVVQLETIAMFLESISDPSSGELVRTSTSEAEQASASRRKR